MKFMSIHLFIYGALMHTGRLRGLSSYTTGGNQAGFGFMRFFRLKKLCNMIRKDLNWR